MSNFFQSFRGAGGAGGAGGGNSNYNSSGTTSRMQSEHDRLAYVEKSVYYNGNGNGKCPKGTMHIQIKPNVPCPGYSGGSIYLAYDIPSALQQANMHHPNPGIMFDGIYRYAYMPNTPEGRQLLTRYKYAFLHGHMFQVGRSLTTGKDNQVTWSPNIPNKSSLRSGPPFGFPDLHFIDNANRALDQSRIMMIPSADNCLQFLNDHQRVQVQGTRQQQSQVQGTRQQQGGASPVAVAVPVPVGAMTPSVPLAVATAAVASSVPNQYSATTTNGIMTSSSAIPNNNQNQGYVVHTERIPYQAPKCLAATTLMPGAIQPWNPPSSSQTTTQNDADDEECSICLDSLTSQPSIKITTCGHNFHQACLNDALKHGSNCPVCRQPLGSTPVGKSPSGTMSIEINPTQHCPGFVGSGSGSAAGVITIVYKIPSGTQENYMEHPGVQYDGTVRIAYLPMTCEGRQLLYRLKYAFQHGLTFRVGTSLTSHKPNQVTWTSIHHKTSLHGGQHSFPDPKYLDNCNGSLDALHVPAAKDCGYK